MTEVNFSELAGFQPKQLAAMEAVKSKTYTLYGGSAGGGKSYFLRWIAVYLLIYYAAKYKIKGVRLGLFCEDYPSLKDRQLSKVTYEFPDWLGHLNKSDSEFVLAEEYGAGIIAFRNLDDPSKYLSSEFVSVLVDELTRNPRETFDFLNMRRRWPGVDDSKFIGTTNPGGIGHEWCKKLWVDRDFDGETFDKDDFTFIRATSKDNKYLPANYDAQLATLPEKLRKAYRDGDWDIFAGQYFTEWNRERNTTLPFPIPDGWTRVCSIDYGYEKPSAVYWGAVDYDGNIYIYRELYVTGHTYTQLARKMKEMQTEEVDYTVADTSMFAKTLDTGESGDALMAKEGVDISPANKDRLAGWNLMHDYIRRGKIVFFTNCVNAIRTIPSLVYKEGTEDVEKGINDHAADSIRYMLQSLPPLPERQTEKVVNPYIEDKDGPWNRQATENPYRY